MKVKQVYIWADHLTGALKAKATINVAGLGDVQFDHALPDDLIAAICATAEAALRVKLGQTVTSTDEAAGT